jgi:hypothetical protein
MRVAVHHRVRLSVNYFRDGAIVVDDEATVLDGDGGSAPTDPADNCHQSRQTVQR